MTYNLVAQSMARARLVIFVLLCACLLCQPAQAQVSGPIYVAQVDGVVTSFTVSYLRRALQVAEASDATAFIVNLESQGAVLRSIRPFAAELAEANVPVVVYVAPRGTNAGAAGAFLLSAANVAAMAPETSFGAPTPLAQVDSLLTEQTQDLFRREVSEQLSDWNTERGRGAEWVDRAVREGVLLTSEQAVATAPPSIDIVARDQNELLTLLQGRGVTLEGNREATLDTLGRSVVTIRPTAWEQFLLFLGSPTTAFLLLIMAAIAFYAELVTPTVGVLAGISFMLLISALVGFAVLPVNWLSLIGVLIAFGLVSADLFVPSHGAFTVVGLGILVVSALTLYDAAQAPGVFVALWAVVMVAFLIASVTAIGIWIVVRTRNRPITTGQEGLVGRLAEVRQQLNPEGMVFVEGALWGAISEDGAVDVGEYVRITAVYELRLTVRRLDVEA